MISGGFRWFIIVFQNNHFWWYPANAKGIGGPSWKCGGHHMSQSVNRMKMVFPGQTSNIWHLEWLFVRPGNPPNMGFYIILDAKKKFKTTTNRHIVEWPSITNQQLILTTAAWHQVAACPSESTILLGAAMIIKVQSGRNPQRGPFMQMISFFDWLGPRHCQW